MSERYFVGYARVSTGEQKMDLQLDALEEAGCEKVFTDKTSGAKANRPGLKDAMEYCRPGDTLVVWRLDRFGRSLKDLVTKVEQLEEREVAFKSLQENIDTGTSGGKLQFHIFSALAEFERTMAGLRAARARGNVGGRPPVMDEKKIQMASHLKKNTDSTVEEIRETLGISKSTFYRYAGPDGDIRKGVNNESS